MSKVYKWTASLVVIALVGWFGIYLSKKSNNQPTAAEAVANNLTSNTTESNNTDQLSTTYTYSGQDGKNAFELLNTQYQVDFKDSSFGAMVTSINGLAAPEGYFWEFLVNNQPAIEGASSYITHSTDTITWRLTKFE